MSAHLSNHTGKVANFPSDMTDWICSVGPVCFTTSFVWVNCQ